MKSWLAKFRVSAALDEIQQPPAPAQSDAARSAEIDRFAAGTAALHEALRKAPLPDAKIPPGFHAAIMRAVKASDQPTLAQTLAYFWRRTALAGSVAVIIAGAWWMVPRLDLRQETSIIARTQTLAAPSSALKFGEEVTGAMPATLIAPLSEEWKRMNRDLDRTTEFLLASLP